MSSNVRNWPATRIQMRSLESLLPFIGNARTHSAEQIGQLAGSMRRWGVTMPILVDETGTILAGHGRALAARQVGLPELPVVVAEGWSAEEKRAYVLADNKLAQNAGWDAALQRTQLEALKAAGFDLAVIGFSTKELTDIFAVKQPFMGLTDPDAVPPLPDRARSQRGWTWLLGAHRLTCGDSTNAEDVRRALAGVAPRLMVTDPPYGVDYDPAWRHRAGVNRSRRVGAVANDDRADWRAAWAHFGGEVAYVWHGALHSVPVAESLTACGFEVRSQIIWAKDRLVIGRGHYHWQHEPCLYAVRGKGGWTGGRKQTTLWSIPSRNQDADTVHGTQKPVECMKRPIENNSAVGDFVYEPFSGSGTTIIAAEAAGRTCLAVDLDPLYCDVAVRRWQQFTGEQAVLEGDGRKFDDIVEAAA